MSDQAATPAPFGASGAAHNETSHDGVAVDFFDPATNDCPYHAYAALRDEAPVWVDERTRMYVITRYDDVKMVLRDTERFSAQRPAGRRDKRGELIQSIYREKGWVPGRNLAARDDPEHKQMRALFNQAFRPSRINELDPSIAALADRLIDDFIDDGTCDWTRRMAIPLPLIVIGLQMGANEDDIWQIKAWTDAWVQRLGMMQTTDEVIWSTEMEIEAQHYFQPIFERLRREPDDTLLSELVNTVIPEWGRTLTDEELHAEMMADTFVGGSETTTNAISHGVKLLIEHPAEWAKLKADPDRYLPVLAEEVIRLEGPVQGLFRTAAVDVELHGVTIPAGSLVNVRYAAANRDDRVFADADRFDLDRTDYKQHVGFGFGTHFCLGAPLARREIIHSFRALVDRVDHMWFVDGANDFKIAPNYCLRALEHLHIAFTPTP
jgi:cytochrome P450